MKETGGAVEDTMYSALPFSQVLAAANAWSDPLWISELFHGGPSWYSGNNFFNTDHTSLGRDNIPRIHIDPWGPYNEPAHFLFQVVGGWLGGGRELGSMYCVFGVGCS
ncbi:MAG: hypothetical protein ACRD1E_02715, partial [Terriglobales bacterium]